MISFAVPDITNKIHNNYRDIFDAIPDTYICTYITTSLLGFDSISDTVRSCPNSKSVSSISYAIASIPPEQLNRAMRRLRASVLRKMRKDPDAWVYVIDTTSNPKTTQNIVGLGNWANSNGSIYKGRNILVLCAVNIKTGVCIPIAWASCEKKDKTKGNKTACNDKDETTCDKNDETAGDTKNEKTSEDKHKTAWVLALELLDLISSEKFPKLTVCADSWFDSIEFMKELENRGFKYNIELKSNRSVKTLGENSVKTALTTYFHGSKKKQTNHGTRNKGVRNQNMEDQIPKDPLKVSRKYIVSDILKITTSSKKNHDKEHTVRISAVYNYAANKYAFAFYATNHENTDYDLQWKLARRRWNIEVMFRDLKQELGWGKIAHKNQIGSDLCVVIPFIILAYIRTHMDEDNTKSIGNILKSIRHKEELRSIKFIINNPSSKLISKFNSRMAPERACLKPVDCI